MDFKRMTDRAKQLVDAAGGTEGVKDKATDLKRIATGQGSLGDKAKAAAEVVREDPQATGEPAAAAGSEAGPGSAEPAEQEAPTGGEDGRERGGRRRHDERERHRRRAAERRERRREQR